MLEEIRKRLLEYLEGRTWRDVADEFGIDHAALYRFAHGTQSSLTLNDRVLDMIVALGVLKPGE